MLHGWSALHINLHCLCPDLQTFLPDLLARGSLPHSFSNSLREERAKEREREKKRKREIERGERERKTEKIEREREMERDREKRERERERTNICWHSKWFHSTFLNSYKILTKGCFKIALRWCCYEPMICFCQCYEWMNFLFLMPCSKRNFSATNNCKTVNIEHTNMFINKHPLTHDTQAHLARDCLQNRAINWPAIKTA